MIGGQFQLEDNKGFKKLKRKKNREIYKLMYKVNQKKRKATKLKSIYGNEYNIIITFCIDNAKGMGQVGCIYISKLLTPNFKHYYGHFLL